MQTTRAKLHSYCRVAWQSNGILRSIMQFTQNHFQERDSVMVIKMRHVYKEKKTPTPLHMKSYIHFSAHLDHNLLNMYQRWKHGIQGLLVNHVNMKAMHNGSAVQTFLATTQTFTKDMEMYKHTLYE
jgi:hypothetical protein